MYVQKPAVKKRTLLLVSGLMWSAVGLFLNYLALHWLLFFSRSEEMILVFSGVMGAIIIAQFGFGKIAEKNIKRIKAYSDQVCVFAFQEWKSYILIAIMMSVGTFLRSAGIIPKSVLTPMYIGIGTALFLSGFKYYINYFNLARNE